MLLSVRDVTLRFGGIVALDGVSFEVERGVVSGLIGPNGAGKTTVFNVITRLYTPDSGEVDLDGTTLLRTPPHGIVRRGVARTFQNINLFRTMSVLENVLVGGHALGRRVGEQDALDALEIVGLADRAHHPAAALPYGTQKRIELARALMAQPTFLLLDERKIHTKVSAISTKNRCLSSPIARHDHATIQEVGAVDLLPLDVAGQTYRKPLLTEQTVIALIGDFLIPRFALRRRFCRSRSQRRGANVATGHRRLPS